MRIWQRAFLERMAQDPDETVRDRAYRNMYVHGMTVGEISTTCKVDEWIVQRAILGPAYGKPQEV